MKAAEMQYSFSFDTVTCTEMSLFQYGSISSFQNKKLTSIQNLNFIRKVFMFGIY